jgi:ABC-type uncharacterized transport system involved in gliding motility auxiliary subunit
VEELNDFRAYRIIGAVGVLLVVAGGILYGILYTSGWITLLPLAAGLALSLFSFLSIYRRAASEGSKRSVRFGMGSGLLILTAAAIMLLLQTLSVRHTFQVDLTSNKRFTLSPQTMKVLGALDRPVHLTCFIAESDHENFQLIQDVLGKYSAVTRQVTFELINPNRKPDVANKYGYPARGPVFIESGGIVEEVDGSDEESFTNAIARISSGSSKTVCFVTGHGEKSTGETGPAGFSRLIEALRTENFEVRDVVVLSAAEIPDLCSIVVIAGPKSDILKHEQNLILDFLSGGGRALFMIDPMTETQNIEGILSSYGILLGNDLIVDRQGKLLAGNYLTPVVNRYGEHPITEGFGHYSFFPQTRSVDVMDDPPLDTEGAIIARTNEGAYSETDLATLVEGQTQYEPSEDAKGPINIAAAAVMRVPDRDRPDSISTLVESRIAVFGDSDFAGNSNLRLAGNRDLVMNTINWLAEAEDLIAIRPDDELFQPVLLSATQGRFVFWIPVIALPALVLLAGAAVLTWRRKTVR